MSGKIIVSNPLFPNSKHTLAINRSTPYDPSTSEVRRVLYPRRWGWGAAQGGENPRYASLSELRLCEVRCAYAQEPSVFKDLAEVLAQVWAQDDLVCLDGSTLRAIRSESNKESRNLLRMYASETQRWLHFGTVITDAVRLEPSIPCARYLSRGVGREVDLLWGRSKLSMLSTLPRVILVVAR